MCTLCLRVGAHCVFPTKRKRPDRSRVANCVEKSMYDRADVDTFCTLVSASPQTQADPTEELEQDACGTSRPTITLHTAAGVSRGGIAMTTATTNPVWQEQALRMTTSALEARISEREVHDAFYGVDASVYAGEVLGFQESFSPSVSGILLENVMSDSHFWQTSHKFSAPGSQQTGSSCSQRLDHHAALLEPKSLVTETSLQPEQTSSPQEIRSSLYALIVPESLTKELLVYFVPPNCQH